MSHHDRPAQVCTTAVSLALFIAPDPTQLNSTQLVEFELNGIGRAVNRALTQARLYAGAGEEGGGAAPVFYQPAVLPSIQVITLQRIN